MKKLVNKSEKKGNRCWVIRTCLFWQGTPPVCLCDGLNVCVWGGGNLFSCFLATLNSDSVKQEFAFQLGSDTLILCYKGNIPFVLLCKFLFRNSRWLGCSQDLDKSFFKAQTMCIVTKITVSAKGGTDTKLCGVWLTFWTSQVFGTMHKEVLQKT